MPPLSPTDVVRSLFELHAAGHDRQLCSLMAEDVTAVSVVDGELIEGIEAVRAWLVANDDRTGPRRTEVQAHHLVADGDDVVVHGRVRVFCDGALSDSPAAWRFTVRDGLVRRVVPLSGADAPAEQAPRSVAA